MKSLLFFCFLVYSLAVKNYEQMIPFPFFRGEENIAFSKSEPQNYPIWPESFNTTLLKLNYINNTITWTKLFYDFKNKRTRFDFYSQYYGKEMRWGDLESSILFVGSTCWFINPKERSKFSNLTKNRL